MEFIINFRGRELSLWLYKTDRAERKPFIQKLEYDPYLTEAEGISITAEWLGLGVELSQKNFNVEESGSEE